MPGHLSLGHIASTTTKVDDRVMRFRSIALLLACLGCGEDDAPTLTFDQALELEYTIVAGADPDLNVAFDSTNRTSLYAGPGETFHGLRYAVPAYHCLRADGTDWNELPQAASAPGESAYFEVLLPLAGTDNGTLVYMPHGDGLEFIETFALEIYKPFPDLAATFGVDPVTGTRGVEQSTRKGAKRNIVSTSVSRSAIALARLGATVVIPGNCWGDGGHGMGRDGDGYYQGRRYGGAFDHAVWTWAREQLPHDPARAVAVGCSGGGHRIAEELIRDPVAFRAAIIDSPADNVAEFLTDPLPDLLQQTYTILRAEKFDALMAQFYAGVWGDRETAAKSSLGVGLAKRAIALPIYLTYSPKDPLVTFPVVRALVDEVAARPAPSIVVAYDLEEHCQLNTDQRMMAATSWLTSVLAP
jgi:hypothetical protein